MIFRRRKEESYWEKLRVWLWPRRSWSRSFSFMYKRVIRLTASPHAIAVGLAAGIFASWTPFFGLHFLIAFMFCYLFSGSYVAGAIGTFFGNPITFPFILATSFSTGRWIISTVFPNLEISGDVTTVSFDYVYHHFWEFFETFFLTLLIGGVVPGIIMAFISYYIARYLCRMYQEARVRQLAKRNEDQANQIGLQ